MPSAARCLRGMVSPERPQQSNNPRCDGRCMREGRQESAGATVGTGVRAGAGAYGRYRELCTREGRHGHAARGRVRGPVHARRAQGRAGAAVGRSVRVRTNEPSRALEPMRALESVRHAGGDCQTATVAHQRPRFKTAPTTSRAAPNRTSAASTSNVNEKPARKSSGRPST